MARLPLIIRQPWQCAGMLCILLLDTVQFLRLCLHAPATLAAGSLFQWKY